MKTLLYLIIGLILIGLSPNLKAQSTIKPLFFHNKDKTDFNLPQLGVSLSLPALAGFKTMPTSKKNVFTDMQDGRTDYFFDITSLDESNDNHILFSLKDNSVFFRMSMTAGEAKLTRMAVSQRPYFVDFTSSLKTKLGKTTSYKMKQKDETHEVHLLNYNGYLYAFSFNSDINKNTKKEFEKIIKSFRAEKYSLGLLTYENKLRNGYFDKESKKTDNPDIFDELASMEGSVSKETTFDFEKLNYSVTIPQKWEYKISGKQVDNLDKVFNRIELDGVDLIKNSMIVNWFRSPNSEIGLIFRSYFYNTTFNVEEFARKQAADAIYSKVGNIVIDGIEFPAIIYGTKDQVALTFYYTDNDIKYITEIFGITEKNASTADDLLSAIKIESNNLPRAKSNTNKPFSSVFKLAPLSSVKIGKVLLPEPDLTNTFKCNLSALGLEMNLYGASGDYQSSIGGKDKQLPKNAIISDLPKENTQLSLYSLSNSGVSVTIRKDPKPMDLKITAEGMFRSFSSNKNISIFESGISTIKSKNWHILLYQQGTYYLGFMKTYKDDYEVLVTVRADSKEELLKKAAIIKSFTFK